MKSSFIIKIIIITLLVCCSQPVFAADSIECQQNFDLPSDFTDQSKKQSGILPTSFFYIFDKVGEFVKYNIFSLTNEAKIKTLLDQLEERKSEIMTLRKNNKLTDEQVNNYIFKTKALIVEITTRLEKLDRKPEEIQSLLARQQVLIDFNFDVANSCGLADIYKGIELSTSNTPDFQKTENSAVTTPEEIDRNGVSTEIGNLKIRTVYP